jgi:hypothetical protein
MSRTIRRAAAVAAIVLLGGAIGPGVAGADRGRPGGHDHRRHHQPRVRWLTAEQRQCLANQARSVRPRVARRPVARVIAWRAAFRVCGVTFPPGKPSVSTTTTSSTSTTTTTTTTNPPPIEPN